MKKKVEITPRLFDAVKIMTKGGATIPEISEFFNIGSATVSRIRASETLEEYRQACKAAYLGIKRKREEAKKNVPPKEETPEPIPEQKPEEPEKPKGKGDSIMVSQYQLNRMVKAIEEQTEWLKLLSNKVAFIVDELTK